MQPTPEQITALTGFVVSGIVGLLKLIPKFDASPRVVKITTVVVGSVLGVGFTQGWGHWQQMGWATVAALATYQLVGKPIRADIEEAGAFRDQ